MMITANRFINEFLNVLEKAAPILILLTLLGGAAAVGAFLEKVDNLGDEVEKLENLPAKMASVETEIKNQPNLSTPIANLEKTVARLEDTVKDLKDADLPRTVAGLNATMGGLKSAIERLDARQEKSASKEDIARIEGELKDLQRMLIQKGVARTSNLPALEDALGGTPSLKVSDSASRQIFFIVPEDQHKADGLLARWSQQAPAERQKLSGEYLSQFKPEIPVWEVRDSQEAYLYRFGEMPSSVRNVFERILSSPSAFMVPFGFGVGFTK